VGIKDKLLLATVLVAIIFTATAIYMDDSGADVSNKVANGEAEMASASLNAARQAFWERDLEGAEKLYRNITISDVDNINAWGELGNIYFMQSKWKDAARAYTEVTLKLIEMQDFQQAAYMHSMVNRLDRDQAERINEHLRTLQMSNSGVR